MLQPFYCDFHIHVGRSLGKPVKMAAAPALTLQSLLRHAREQKGLDAVCVIDGVCTNVLQEFRALLRDGELQPVQGGGYRYTNGLAVLLGAEVETGGPSGGAAHFGCWFGTVEAAADFHDWLATVQKNPSLSSQRARTDAFTLQREVAQRNGLFVIHHAFTPHKGLYGNCVTRMADMLDPTKVDAVELGLSADTDMADCLSELSEVSFLTNSDAHSVQKIAREYNCLMMATPSFNEVRLALHRKEGRCVNANYGLHPALGKYHRTYCLACGNLWEESADSCACGSTKRVMGVYDRLLQVRDRAQPTHPAHRPPYVHQVPLQFVPGLGPKALKRLLSAFGSEMSVLHEASVEQIAEVVGQVLADKIDQTRTGRAAYQSGGGGTYGKIHVHES